MKHTPGPWTEEREVNAADGYVGTEIHHSGFHIGTWIDNESDGRCGNSRLIAAAPDLLTACEAVLVRLDHRGNFGMAGDPLCKEALMTFLKSAVAKVRG